MYESRFFATSTGYVAVAVLLYILACDALFVVSFVVNPHIDDNDVFVEPVMFAAQAILGIPAVICAMLLIDHACKNPHIPSGWRMVLWVFAVLVGYGQIVYWWIHVRNGRDLCRSVPVSDHSGL